VTIKLDMRKSLHWITLSDLSDEEAKLVQFTVRFKLAETASAFQEYLMFVYQFFIIFREV